MEYKIVIDTSVLISGLYSNRGAAFKLLEEIDHPDLKVYVSTRESGNCIFNALILTLPFS